MDGDEIETGKLLCEKGHSWPVDEGIPALVYPKANAKDEAWIKQYDEMAEKYDQRLKTYDEWLGIDMMKDRERLGNYVTMEGPSKIADVSMGTGANLVALYNRFRNEMGRFNLHGLEMSHGMLRVAGRKLKDLGVTACLIQGNVLNLPYQDDYFNLVIHTGGINTFSDKSQALEEMWRVVKPWGIVVVTDEGLSPEVRRTERGKEILKTNSLFGSKPPLEHVPSMVRHLEVSYVLGGTFYQMVFNK
jgi:ubiquinone/menaquinone biosynthesis C-methylase UbiE